MKILSHNELLFKAIKKQGASEKLKNANGKTITNVEGHE